LIIALVARHGLPAVYANRFFVTGGGLISYGTHLIDQSRLPCARRNKGSRASINRKNSAPDPGTFSAIST